MTWNYFTHHPGKGRSNHTPPPRSETIIPLREGENLSLSPSVMEPTCKIPFLQALHRQAKLLHPKSPSFQMPFMVPPIWELLPVMGRRELFPSSEFLSPSHSRQAHPCSSSPRYTIPPHWSAQQQNETNIMCSVCICLCVRLRLSRKISSATLALSTDPKQSAKYKVICIKGTKANVLPLKIDLPEMLFHWFSKEFITLVCFLTFLTYFLCGAKRSVLLGTQHKAKN